MKYLVLVAAVLSAQLDLAVRQDRAAAATSPGDARSVLLEVSFSGGRDIERDDGTGPYGAPHWQGSPQREYPYLIRAGRALTIGNVKVKIFAPIPGIPLIRGTRNGVITIPATLASPVGTQGDVYEISSVAAAAPFPDNRTAFYERFDIQWEVSRDNGSVWEAAGISSNSIYVCLSDTSPAPLLRTVVHLACSN